MHKVPDILIVSRDLGKDIRRNTRPRNQREISLFVSRNEPGPPLIEFRRIPEFLLLRSRLLRLLAIYKKFLEVIGMLQVPLSIRRQVRRLPSSLVLLHQVGDEAFVILVL